MLRKVAYDAILTLAEISFVGDISSHVATSGWELEPATWTLAWTGSTTELRSLHVGGLNAGSIQSPA